MQIIEDLHLSRLRSQAHLPTALILIFLQSLPVILAIEFDIGQSMRYSSLIFLAIKINRETRCFGIFCSGVGATVRYSFLHEL